MGSALGAIALALSFVLLWTGKKHLGFGSFVGTLLSVVELAGLVIAVVSLGWWGLIVPAVVNVVAVLVWSVILAARFEERLTYAGIQARAPTATMKALAARLGRRKELASLTPIKRADLIKLLAERGRTVDEIEAMAVPIAMLYVVHAPDLEWLVDHFDRLLRRAGKSATEAMEVADVITAGTLSSAATFTEMVEALVAFYD